MIVPPKISASFVAGYNCNDRTRSARSPPVILIHRLGSDCGLVALRACAKGTLLRMLTANDHVPGTTRLCGLVKGLARQTRFCVRATGTINHPYPNSGVSRDKECSNKVCMTRTIIWPTRARVWEGESCQTTSIDTALNRERRLTRTDPN